MNGITLVIAVLAGVFALIIGYTSLYLDYRHSCRNIKYFNGRFDEGFRPIYLGLTPFQRFVAVTVSPIGMALEEIYLQKMQGWYPGTTFDPSGRPSLNSQQLETLRVLAVARIGNGPRLISHIWRNRRRDTRMAYTKVGNQLW